MALRDKMVDLISTQGVLEGLRNQQQILKMLSLMPQTLILRMMKKLTTTTTTRTKSRIYPWFRKIIKTIRTIHLLLPLLRMEQTASFSMYKT
jgi:hypothetical protein